MGPHGARRGHARDAKRGRGHDMGDTISTETGAETETETDIETEEEAETEAEIGIGAGTGTRTETEGTIAATKTAAVAERGREDGEIATRSRTGRRRESAAVMTTRRVT